MWSAANALQAVPGHLVVGILKPLDELLDPDVVSQDLAGHGQFRREDAMRTGSKKTIAPLPSGR